MFKLIVEQVQMRSEARTGKRAVPFGPALAPWPLDSSRTSCRRGLRKHPDCPGRWVATSAAAVPASGSSRRSDGPT